MLLGKDLRRCHEQGQIAGPAALPDERCGNQRFAASDVALQQTVHLPAGAQLFRCFHDGFPLRRGGRKRERRIEGFKIRCRNPDAVLRAALPAPERTGEHEQFLKHKAPPRLLQCLDAFREMDGLVGEGGVRKPELPPQRIRQHLGQTAQAAVQPLADTLAHKLLLQPAAQPVYRDDAPRYGERPGSLFRLTGRVHHAAAAPVHFNPAVESVASAPVNLVAHIGLVEVGDRDLTAVVIRSEAHQIQPAPDAG